MDKDTPINEVGDTKNDFWMNSINKSLNDIAGAIEENTNAIEQNSPCSDIQDLTKEIQDLKKMLAEAVVKLDDSLQAHARAISD